MRVGPPPTPPPLPHFSHFPASCRLPPLPGTQHRVNMTAPKPVSAGGIKLLVRRPAAAPTAAVARLSLEDEVAAKKAAAAAAPTKGPSELFAELLEAANGDVGAAAARIKELLAAGSRDAAALGGLALREGVPALHAHGELMMCSACWCWALA